MAAILKLEELVDLSEYFDCDVLAKVTCKNELGQVEAKHNFNKGNMSRININGNSLQIPSISA
jgi:hypothetical protein